VSSDVANDGGSKDKRSSFASMVRPDFNLRCESSRRAQTRRSSLLARSPCAASRCLGLLVLSLHLHLRDGRQVLGSQDNAERV
jgi:hypothetical protein